MIDTDVLIVGAGPTGLMLGNQLARRGVGCLIVDRNEGPSLRTKALGVQARTLEIYDRLGIAERALAWGTRAAGANIWVNGQRAARVPLGDIGQDLSPFPFLLILGQDDNERLLGKCLRQQGAEVSWATKLIGLEPREDHVTAVLEQADGATRRVSARWLAGCDGAHSAVRDLTGIEFPGAPYEHVFFIADTTATGPMTPGELNVYLWREGFDLFFPLRGTDHWRIVGIVRKGLRADDELKFDALVPSLKRQVGAALSFTDCGWFSIYRIHHRRAARFRAGRCFVLGDAAHVHSPVGAQGMNTGLQDAYNLAWKLALVVAGRAGERLLDTYAAERMPIAERLLATTDRAFALIVSERWWAGFFRTRILARVIATAMRFARTRALAFRTISQIGIHYRTSPLSIMASGWPDDAPQSGDRFPWLRLRIEPGGEPSDFFTRLDDTCFNLVVIGATPPAPPADFRDLLRIHVVVPDDPQNAGVLATARIPWPACFLLRPDGHIGLAGPRISDSMLDAYLVGVIDPKFP